MTTEIPRPISNLARYQQRQMIFTQLSSTQSKKTRNDSIHSLHMEVPWFSTQSQLWLTQPHTTNLHEPLLLHKFVSVISAQNHPQNMQQFLNTHIIRFNSKRWNVEIFPPLLLPISSLSPSQFQGIHSAVHRRCVAVESNLHLYVLLSGNSHWAWPKL